MKYVSIDIETTGLDPESNQILSIGAIVEDTKLKLSWDEIPKFNVIVLQRQIIGSPRAITMNNGIIELMGVYLEGDIDLKRECGRKSGYKFLEKEDVVKEFYSFLKKHYEGNENDNTCLINGNTQPILLNIAGKNFGTFDLLFLKQLPWWQKIIRTRHRIIDPAILCCDWNTDDELPSLKICKERQDIQGNVTHNALEDAWDVIQVLRKFY